jgi:hypothetical protein
MDICIYIYKLVIYIYKPLFLHIGRNKEHSFFVKNVCVVVQMNNKLTPHCSK